MLWESRQRFNTKCIYIKSIEGYMVMSVEIYIYLMLIFKAVYDYIF